MQNQKQENELVCEATTREFAKLHGIQASSLLAHFGKNGSYYGIKPRKLVNGRLLWPSVSLTKKEGTK